MQQPTDWNIIATHTDTTMTTLPTHANLLNYTSSSEEESSSSGKPPSNQTIVGSTLDHGVLNHTAATPTPIQRNDEENTYETDLNNVEQAEESTVVIPSIPTVQEITRYVYDSPYDGLVTNPDTGAIVELQRSMASQFLVNNCKLPTMFCMLMGYPNFNNIHDQAPFCNAKPQLKSTWKVVNDNMKTEIHLRSYFLLKELPHDDNHPLKKRAGCKIPKTRQWKKNDLLSFLQNKTLNIDTQLMDSCFIKWWVGRFKAYVEHAALEADTKIQSTQTIWSAKGWTQGLVPNLRLIEIVLGEHTLEAFIGRDNTLSRQQLDALHSENAPVDFWEGVMIDFNDPSKKYESVVLSPGWGGRWFQKSHPLNWDNLHVLGISSIDEPKKAKQYFTNLNNSLGNVYQAWNASGSGDGMKQKGMETGEQEVDLENLPTQSGDRLDFLRGANPCVMYLWYKLLSHGLFQTSAAEFPVGLGADGGVAPDISVTSSVAGSKESYKEESGVSAMALHIGSLVMVQSKMNREKNLQMSLRALMAERTENTQERQFLVEKVEKAEQKLEVHEDALWQYCEEKGLDNNEGFEVQPNDSYVVQQKKRRCHNVQQLLNDYKDQLRMCKEARDNLDYRIQMKHQVIDGLQDGNEPIAAGSTPGPLQEITPRRSGSGKRKSPPSVVRMNLGITEGDVESGNGDGDITES